MNMRLEKIKIENFRSIISSGEINIRPLQAFVGENNAGKSNVLKAIKCFLTAGAGGMQADDFNNPNIPASIECEFSQLSDEEKIKLRPYLLNDRIILRKELRTETDEEKDKKSVKSEYHGYQAEPTDPAFSISKIEKIHGAKPNWRDIALNAGILEFVEKDGKVNKTTYTKGLKDFLAANDVAYDEPEIGTTQALGLAQNLLAVLPEIFLLPAITDYSDEIDRRSTTTVFRRLMAELSDRIIQSDPRYNELEDAILKIQTLLNPDADANAENRTRLTALENAEGALLGIFRKLMPGVQSVSLNVEIEAVRDIFSKGVNIKVNDGVLTDVLDKGNGMQRSLVFSLLQMLIATTRNQDQQTKRPIILAIEEPELYIHPHSQRLIFRVLKEFSGLTDATPEAHSGVDQVIYTTHSPAFIEVWNYHRIGVVKKNCAKRRNKDISGTGKRARNRRRKEGLQDTYVFWPET
jgi:predicted ATP-dependent endonuclease of OLD family